MKARKDTKPWRHRDWRFLSRRQEKEAERDAIYILAATATPTDQERTRCEPKETRQKSVIAKAIRERRLYHGPFFKSRVYGLSQPNDNVATSLGLIRNLHKIYIGYPTHVNRGQSGLALWLEPIKPQERVLTAEEESQTCVNKLAREVKISFSSCNWDIMLIDVTRSLSRTTLGALVVFAVRMGMQWRCLYVIQGRMLASENGYNLSFIEMPGLGCVTRLVYAGDHGVPPPLIPGFAAEKLLFGIIPGCHQLVKADFCCPTIKEPFDKLNILNTLRRSLTLGSFADDIKKAICDPTASAKPLYRAFDNGVIALLSEFLPVSSSAASTHYCWL